VALDALVVDPDENPISYAWYACVMPARGQGFFGGGGQTQTSGGDGTPLDTDPDGSSCKVKFERGRPYTWSLGSESTARFVVPADLIDDDAAVQLAFGLPEGIEIPPIIRTGFLAIAGLNVTVELTVSNGLREIVTRKWINVSAESPLPDNARNLNPADVAAVLADDGAPSSPNPSVAPPADGRCFASLPEALSRGESYTIEPANFPSEPAAYLVLLAGSTTGEPFEVQPRTETYFYSFYATAGSLAKETSRNPGEPSNTWSFSSEDAGEVRFWMVTRDGRGGIAWCEESVTVD
jgi:hypothetical protein